MSRRTKKVFGFCKLCGREGPLTFDHVPPRAAFNDGNFYSVPDEEMYDWAPNEEFKGKLKQGGVGFYSLCAKCNNDTGSWYGRDFTWWCRDAAHILVAAKGRPSLYYPQKFFPLRIIKQVITMFLSMNEVNLREGEPELARFVLNREERYLNPKYRIFAYYNYQGHPRFKSYSVIWDNGVLSRLSEIAFPPIGYVLTFNSPPPDLRQTEITYFSAYGYNDWKEIAMRFPVLETHLPMAPGDYRSIEEIQKAVESGRKSKYYRGKRN
nr:hypothetical protein [uncultured bacterium]